MMRVWVKDAREALGLTQSQVAAASGISESYFCQIETGKRRPRPELAKIIAAVLCIEWTRFYDDEEDGAK